MSPIPSLTIHEPDLPFATGMPVPAAEAESFLSGALLTDADGAVHPLQVAALMPPTPDGCRWLEIAGAGAAAGPATVAPGSIDAGTSLVAGEAGAALLTVGKLRLTLKTDPASAPLVVERRCDEGKWTCLGELSPEVVTEGGLVHLEGPRAERELRVLRNGAVRGQAELTGRLEQRPGEPSMHYRLTVEVWQGVTGARIDFMLTHAVAGVAEMAVQRATLRGLWEVGEPTLRRFLQQNHGPYYKRREVANPRSVALITDDSCGPVHVRDAQMLLDTVAYAHYLQAPLIQTGDWLTLAGPERWVTMRLRDFVATRPNQLRSEGQELSYDLLPDGHGCSWPQGRRKEQTLLLTFGTGESTQAAGAMANLEALLVDGRAQPAPAYLAAMRNFDLHHAMPAVKGENVRLSIILRRLCQLKTPSCKWDLGDTIDPGYTRTYPAVPHRLEWLPGAPEVPVRFDAAGRSLWGDSVPHLIEPVWTNNEYDILHALASETMRCGGNDHLQMLRWASRHVIEIDFRSYSDDRWHHQAQPAHSAHHNTTGAYPSHFWTQGLLQYYALTGDRDAEQVALALGDKIIEHNHVPEMRQWGFDRELGWGLLSLVCLLEAGYSRYRQEADAIVEYLMAYDRAAYAGAVNLSAGRAGRSLERQMVDNGFGYSSMVEAIDRYQRVTGRDDTAAWLETLLRQLKGECWNAIDDGEVPGVRGMMPMVMSIGYARTADEDFIAVGLIMLESFFDALSMGEEAHFGYVKSNAMLYRGLARFLGDAHRLDRLAPFEFASLLRRRGR